MKNLFQKILLFALFMILIGVIIEQKILLKEAETWRYRWSGQKLIDREGQLFISLFPNYRDSTLMYINQTIYPSLHKTVLDTTYFHIISKKEFDNHLIRKHEHIFYK